MTRTVACSFILPCLLAIGACHKPSAGQATNPVENPPADGLLKVGEMVIYQSDLDHHLAGKFAGRSDAETRKLALDELAERALFAQAAIDADLDRDPIVRAEVARILSSRLREIVLTPKLQEASAPVAEDRRRELYAAQPERFAAKEQRQLAVLWLNPGSDSARVESYTKKLNDAREWFFNSSELGGQPEKGFSVLSVDHSEHAASRFQGGVVGWMETGGYTDKWRPAVAEIGFEIGKAGDVSAVTSSEAGIFLVRLMAIKPASQRSFESVRDELERQEQNRLRSLAESEFEERILAE